MTSLFSAKSLGLYSLAIGGSIALFHLVTGYGEAHVRAPSAVGGIYSLTHLEADRHLATCLHHQKLLLDLQQSGRYLNASLVGDAGSASTVPAHRPTLSGQLRDRQLNLSGLLPTTICPQLARVQIAGTIGANQQLQGQLWLTDERSGAQLADRPLDFTATLQPSASRAAPSH